MYLKRVRRRGTIHYILRESIWCGDHWGYRNLFDLGEHPESFIVYPGGNGFYFKAELEDALEKQNVKWEPEELERIFYPFLRPDIRRILDIFGSRGSPKHRWKGWSDEQLFQHQRHLHSFDKRRLHFLRCGRVNIGNLEGRAWKFLNILIDKCRDEIENIIDEMEKQLRPYEIKPYVFTSLHLQTYFPNHLLRNHPAALDQEKLDGYFLEAICKLNSDPTFFKGVPDHDPGKLHSYLVKYVIYYFDYGFDTHRSWREFNEEFINQRFANRFLRRSNVSIEEACDRLGISYPDFKRMTVRDLVRRYRTKAMELHPDRGGSHDAFVHMMEAYQVLLQNMIQKI